MASTHHCEYERDLLPAIRKANLGELEGRLHFYDAAMKDLLKHHSKLRGERYAVIERILKTPETMAAILPPLRPCHRREFATGHLRIRDGEWTFV